MSRRQAAVLVAVALLIAAFFALGGHRLLTFENIKAQQAALQAAFERHPWRTGLAYFVAYVAITGLSLPGAAVMTLLGGAVFGLLWGTLIVSFASSVGATLAFLASRFVLRDWVQARFGHELRALNEGFAREGGFYLFSLRLIPVVPFFAINLAMGVVPVRAWTFYWVSQVGMLAGTLVYVNAGTQLARIDSLQGILEPGLIGAFVLLGVFPLMARKAIEAAKARRAYARWRRPRRFDRNLVVIGAGSAGLVAAYIAATVKAKVTLVEKHRMGGDCLNTGCVPSKALIKTARVLAQIRNAQAYGIKHASAEIDFAEVMERVQRVVREIEPHDSVERYTGLGVECLRGDARITSPWTVEIDTAGEKTTLSTRAIVIAAGAEPLVPPIPGIDQVGCLTSESLWTLRELPRRLLVLGGGPIGCELAQAFARLGSRVTQVEMLPRLLPREDPDVSEMVRAKFAEEGIEVLLGHKALEFKPAAAGKVLLAQRAGETVAIEFDQVLCALGRVARTKGYGLEELGITTTRARTIETNEFLQTRFPNIYACGDVAGPYQFTHTASHQAWYAAVNALFAPLRKFRADYSVIPWATFTDPEVARVGLNESEARERKLAHEVTVYRIADLDRAIADSAAHGMVKVLTAPRGDRILGATIVGEHAGELIVEFIAAMRHGIGLKRLMSTIHIYPTYSEANKYAAGAWRKANAPQGALAMVQRFHAWMRG